MNELSLDALKNAPGRLEIKDGELANQLQTLALKNYHVYLNNFDAIKSAHRDAHQLSEAAATASSDIAAALASVKHLHSDGPRLAQAVRMGGRSLGLHREVADVLEMPQLITACARDGRYDAALDVLAKANDMERRCPGRVVAAVAAQARAAAREMGALITSKLCGPLSLAECLSLAAAAQRVEAAVGTTDGGPHLFLRCRHADLLSSLPPLGDDPALWLAPFCDVLDRLRSGWSRISSEFRAAFDAGDTGEEAEAGNPAATAAWDPAQWDDAAPAGGSGDGLAAGAWRQDPDVALLQWVEAQVEEVLALATRVCAELDSLAALHAAAEHAALLARTATRIGVDCRARVAAVFAGRQEAIFAAAVSSASAGLRASLRLSEGRAEGVDPADWVRATGAETAETARQPLAADADVGAAAQRLCAVPAVATACNAAVDAMNDARLYCGRLALVRLRPLVESFCSDLEACASDVERLWGGRNVDPAMREPAALLTGLVRTVGVPWVRASAVAVVAGVKLSEARAVEEVGAAGAYEEEVEEEVGDEGGDTAGDELEEEGGQDRASADARDGAEDGVERDGFGMRNAATEDTGRSAVPDVDDGPEGADGGAGP